jgi:crotonobetainyl-CoA:carnitine CoA-transferase CaiB-like acyl-CoA transferase
VPAGPVNSLDEVYADPQVLHQEMLTELPHPGLESGVVRVAGVAVKLHATPGQPRLHPPMFGEHTREILHELGFNDHDIAGFIDAGVALAPAAPARVTAT